MNSSAILILSVVLASGAAAGVSLAMRPAAETSPVEATTVTDLQRAVAELRAELRTANAALQKLAALTAAPVSPAVPVSAERTAAPAVSHEQVAAAVEAYLEKRAPVAGTAGASAPATVAFDLATDFKALIGTSYWEDSEMWKKAFAAGRIDEVVKKFEELAAQNPTDIPAKMNLANAYMAHMQMDPSKWQLSTKADETYDKVLELDENHWEARFTKAVSYTFWPDFLGKKKDAISHFETLVTQQEKLPVEAHQAQTYLFLGNLLEARDPVKAKEMWAKGARRHPNNEDLAKKAGG